MRTNLFGRLHYVPNLAQKSVKKSQAFDTLTRNKRLQKSKIAKYTKEMRNFL